MEPASPGLIHPKARGLALGVVFLILPPATTTTAADWAGKREVRDGVTHVWNPAEPLDGVVAYDLREQWRLESENEQGEVVFGAIEKVTEDEQGNVYLLDTQMMTIHMVSADGAHVRSIGRAGEGPGELAHPSDLVFTPAGRVGAITHRPPQAVLFETSGLPAGVIPLQLSVARQTWLIRLVPARGGYAAFAGARSYLEDCYLEYRFVLLLDEGGAVAGTALRDSVRVPKTPRRIYEEEREQRIVLLGADRDGHTYVSTSFTDYEFQIHGPGGEVTEVVRDGYAPLARTSEEAAEERGYWDGYYDGKADIRVSKHHRTIAEGLAKRDGTVWIVHARGWRDVPHGVVERVDVFDTEGRYVREAVLRGDVSALDDLVFLLEDRLVVVTWGVGAAAVAVGAPADTAATAGEEAEGSPTVICYALVDGAAGSH